MDNSKKRKVSTGTVVEDALYQFNITCANEHLAQTFLVDLADKMYIGASAFMIGSKNWRKIAGKEPKPDPVISTEFRDYINMYNKNSYKNLRQIIDQKQPWQVSYQSEIHGVFDWMRNSVHNLVREYETKILKRKHLEAWYLMHVWHCFYSVFDNLDDVDAIK